MWGRMRPGPGRRWRAPARRARRVGRRAHWNAAALLGLLISLVWAAAGGPARPPAAGDRVVTVWREDLGRAVPLELETYVLGVVAAEMPADFHVEALKAQAVAARTYVAWMADRGGMAAGAGAVMMQADPAADQAFVLPERAWARLGDGRWERLRRAVRETRGQILTYEGRPILSVYHSNSGGRTEASENYWSEALPYLRSIPDPFSLGAPYDQSVVRVPLSEVWRRLGIPMGAPLRIAARYPGGRVRTVAAGDTRISGREVREALGLNSNWFDLTIEGETAVFTVRGNGHGVGMSQFGAQAMALEGYTYDEILRYYYPGTRLARW
ncbi:MAG TPA: stage II sporulation protein D [Limnochordia bacterium]